MPALLLNVLFLGTSHVLSMFPLQYWALYMRIMGGLASLLHMEIQGVYDAVSFALLSLVFLLAYLGFRRGGRKRALFRAVQLCGLVAAPLGVEVFLFDRSEFFLPVTRFQVVYGVAPWLTNSVFIFLDLASVAIASITLVLTDKTRSGGASLAERNGWVEMKSRTSLGKTLAAAAAEFRGQTWVKRMGVQVDHAFSGLGAPRSESLVGSQGAAEPPGGPENRLRLITQHGGKVRETIVALADVLRYRHLTPGAESMTSSEIVMLAGKVASIAFLFNAVFWLGLIAPQVLLNPAKFWSLELIGGHLDFGYWAILIFMGAYAAAIFPKRRGESIWVLGIAWAAVELVGVGETLAVQGISIEPLWNPWWCAYVGGLVLYLAVSLWVLRKRLVASRSVLALLLALVLWGPAMWVTPLPWNVPVSVIPYDFIGLALALRLTSGNRHPSADRD
ncbi:MAG: hypothetical protein JRN57_01865 [Nitrososphaerota archaeon]|nr:hypothetical protein [Nitrososphaerota archaeon]